MSDSGKKSNAVLYLVLICLVTIGFVAPLLLPKELGAMFYAGTVLVTTVEALVPSISQYAAISEFPDLCRIALVVMWALMPLQALCWACLLPIRKGYVEKRLIAVLSFVVMVVVVAWFLASGIPVGPERLDKDRWHDYFFILAATSRLGLALIGTLTTVGLSLLLGVAVKYLWVIAFPNQSDHSK